MILVHFFRPNVNKYFILFILLTLIACDSSDKVPTLQVDSTDIITDAELHQLQFQQQQKNIFYFGFDLRNSPQEDTAQYLPFLNYLENATGYHFKLYFTPKNSSTGEELGQNKIQFAAMGATSFLKAQEKYNIISLVRGINHHDKAEYQSVFVVRPNSPIKNINNFKNHKLAFGNHDSTQGHLIPRIMLTKWKITLNDLKSYAYTGSHQNCAEAVVSNKYDICGMQDQLAEKLASQGKLKIIHHSDYYPSSGIATNQSLSPKIVAKVKQALLNFKPQEIDSKGLYHWDDTEMPKGFVATEKNDYENLRQWSIRLNFLQDIATPLQGQIQ